jgi:putative endonuclease
MERRRAVERGRQAEARVARVLESAGWRIRARNWRGSGAELDLVISRDDQIRFVEVKQRSGRDPSGLQSIDSRKQARLSRAAHAWLALENEGASDLAFVVAIVRDDGIHWFDDAFEA